MKKAAIIIAIVIFLSSLFSCGQEIQNDESREADTTDVSTNNISSVTAITCSIVSANKGTVIDPENVTSFSKGDYNYYFIKLGQLNNAPVQVGSIITYDGTWKREITFQSTDINVDSTSEEIQRQVKNHTDWSTNVSLPEVTWKGIAVGSAFSHTNNHSFDFIEETVTEQLKGVISLNQTEDKQTLTPGSQVGNYAWVLKATLDVYASIVTDKNHVVKDVSTKTEIVQANYDFQYIGQSTTIPVEYDGSDFKVDCESEAIRSIITKTPNVDLTGEYTIVSKDQNPEYCGKDTDFVKQASDENANLVDPRILDIKLKDADKNIGSGVYIMRDSAPKLYAEPVADLGNIKTYEVKYSSALHSDDAKSVNCFDAVRKLSGKVGEAAIVAEITYSNGNKSVVEGVDILKGKNKGQTIELFSSLGINEESIRSISKIHIIIVYEIKTTKGVFALPAYTDWKYDFTIEFAS